MADFHIRQVYLTTANEVVNYVMGARKELFPMLDHERLPKDLAKFEATYIDQEIGFFLEARDHADRLIGVLGLVAYDHRFSFLSFSAGCVAEVVRLYIDPSHRRRGLAANMVDKLISYARHQKIHTLYLHTHPFLTGAYDFWLKMGFETVAEREHSGFDTIHMQRKL
ncbi:GNAT family N-acetyltransferase [Sphingobacterium corticis]|uniref:GNAT family N-acetyltransferase n=1 Tax=Sphingobacterium corticis TaxID=1812823 RepID=A0ABW5NJX7_9SPHI